MDGVLVNLEKGAFDVHGAKISDVPKPERWDKIHAIKSFWKDLEWTPGAKKIWNFLKPYTPSIMSAWTKHDLNSAKGKEDWLKSHVEKLSRSRINLVMRADKKRFAKDGRTKQPNILIDDHPKNIGEWEAQGGIGIHHTSVNRTIAKLKKLGFA
jgi:5'(3')-deoxyribonucleotidase